MTDRNRRIARSVAAIEKLNRLAEARAVSRLRRNARLQRIALVMASGGRIKGKVLQVLRKMEEDSAGRSGARKSLMDQAIEDILEAWEELDRESSDPFKGGVHISDCEKTLQKKMLVHEKALLKAEQALAEAKTEGQRKAAEKQIKDVHIRMKTAMDQYLRCIMAPEPKVTVGGEDK